MTITPTTFGILVAILTALTRLLPLTRPLWDRLPARWRPWPPAALIVIGAALAIVQAPASWVDQLELILPALLAVLAPGALPAGATHGAGVALLLVLGLGSSGCTGSLEAARAESVVGVRTAAPRPERCESLSDRHVAWGATAEGAGVLAGASGLVSIPVRDEDARTALVAGAVGAASVAAIGAFISTQSATAWEREGCGAP